MVETLKKLFEVLRQHHEIQWHFEVEFLQIPFELQHRHQHILFQILLQ